MATWNIFEGRFSILKLEFYFVVTLAVKIYLVVVKKVPATGICYGSIKRVKLWDMRDY